MKCEYCDNVVPANANRCPSCGAAVSTSAPAPTSAVSAGIHGVPAPAGQMYSATGIPSAPRAVEPKSRLAYVLLGLIFGSFGVHNFYAGRSGRAVGQLLTTLLAGWMIFPVFIVWVWCLVDVCAITTDGNGVRFK